MPRKPKATASKGVAWDPDIYEIRHFVHGLSELRTKPGSTGVPRYVMERLAGLARTTDNETFWAGIKFSLQAARKDFPLLSSPVYRGKLLKHLDEVEEAARFLRRKFQAFKNPADRTMLWASRAIGVEFDAYLRVFSSLIAAIAEAKTSYPYVQFAQEKGTPSGAGESGMALTRFVAHLEFAALAGEGRWTLNKNNRSETLIKAMEGLRDFLPSNFLPPVDQHPYSTYRRILTDARSEWDLGHFPWPKLDQKRRSR
jgi:hypothetical protein